MNRLPSLRISLSVMILSILCGPLPDSKFMFYHSMWSRFLPFPRQEVSWVERLKTGKPFFLNKLDGLCQRREFAWIPRFVERIQTF